jgi:hypothetical protein
MKKQETFIYEDVPLNFNLNGEEITGILNGSFKIWEFRSSSPAFLKSYSNGIISSGMMYLEIKPEQNQIFDSIIEAAEAKGYSFESETE